MQEPRRSHGLAVTETGLQDGDPVVVLHGWGSSAAMMRPVSAALEPRFRVWTVDLPGHGEAPPPSRPMDLAEHASAVRALVRETVGRPAALVGHSNGGRIALYLASEPDAATVVTRLALLAPSGLRRTPSVKTRVRRAVATTLKAPFEVLPGPLREFGLDWLRHSLVWRLLGTSDYRALDGVMRDTFVRLVNSYLETRLASVSAPTLVVWGERDEDIVREQVDRLVALVSSARLEVVPDAGHYAYLDRPDVVLPLLTRFLEADAS